MSSRFSDAVVLLTGIQWIAGAIWAQTWYSRPERLPRRLRAWSPPFRERGGAEAAKLLLQAMGWMVGTAVVTGLLIPLMPIYTTFRWFNAFGRAAVAIRLWPDRSAHHEESVPPPN